VLGTDLRKAALAALELDPAACREHALRYSWAAATSQFVEGLALARAAGRPSAGSAGVVHGH